jgi:hypothetical protein
MVTAAKRAIRRGVPKLTAAQVYLVAALVDTMRYGVDRGHWGISAEYARGAEKGGPR